MFNLRSLLNTVNLTPVPSRRRTVGQHHGDLRPALIRAALEMLERGEDESLTLREIARRAGVSPAAPYHHFRDRAALLAAVAEEGFVALSQALADAAKGARTPEARLARMATRYVTFALEHRSHYRVMVGPLLATAEPSPLGEAALAAFGELERAVADAAPSKADAHGLAMFAWALAHGVVMLSMDGALAPLGATDLEETAARTGEQIVRMVTATAQRSRSS